MINFLEKLVKLINALKQKNITIVKKKCFGYKIQTISKIKINK